MTNYTYGLSLVIANVAIGITSVSYLTDFLGFALALDVGPHHGGAPLALDPRQLRRPQGDGAALGRVFWGRAHPASHLPRGGALSLQRGALRRELEPLGDAGRRRRARRASDASLVLPRVGERLRQPESVDNPDKNVPKAVLLATVGVAFFFVATSVLVGGMVPNAELADSSAPFGIVLRRSSAGRPPRF